MPIDFVADAGFAIRLLVAATLGALVGLEREIHEHPAGMRTHLLVSLGSAGFTVLSIVAFPAPGADPARIAAQIVSGVGFLGAGAILKEGATIRGLTTAASLWAVAAVGMAAGAGAWVLAVTLTAIAIISLWPLRLVTERIIGPDRHHVQLRVWVERSRPCSPGSSRWSSRSVGRSRSWQRKEPAAVASRSSSRCERMTSRAVRP